MIGILSVPTSVNGALPTTVARRNRNRRVYTKTFERFNGGDFKFLLPDTTGDNIWDGTQDWPSNGQEIQYNQSVTGTFGGGSNFSPCCYF